MKKEKIKLADIMPVEEVRNMPQREDRKIIEKRAARVMSESLGIPLTKQRLEIYGKYKEFDVVNVEHRIVGDVKKFDYEGDSPSGQMDFMSQHIRLMEKLEESTGKKWKKMIVGLGNRKVFETYARRNNPWLEDVEIYFIDNGKVEKIR